MGFGVWGLGFEVWGPTGCPTLLRMSSSRARIFIPQTVEYVPFIKNQLAPRKQLQGLMWCTSGFRVYDSGLKVQGLQFKIKVEECVNLDTSPLAPSSTRHRL